MGLVKTGKVIAFVVACAGIAALQFHFALGWRAYLDENDGLTRYSYAPTDFVNSAAYLWAIDTPAVSRWIDYGALRLFGVETGEIPIVKANAGYRWNVEHGRLAPRGPVNFLRKVNVVWLLAAFACLVILAKVTVGSYGWGLVAIAPLALSREFGGPVAAFIFADAQLAFFVALFGLMWVRFHLGPGALGWANVATMGIIAGLAVSTKYNAGLLVVAYATYAVGVAKGKMRLWKPVVFAATTFAVFVILNPVTWRGGPAWWGQVIHDIFKHRVNLLEIQREFFGKTTLWGRIAAIFPWWYALPIPGYVVWRARREKWFLPAALWAGFLAVGTMVTIHEVFFRYRMPIYMPLCVVAMLSAISACRPLSHTAATEPGDGQGPEGTGGGSEREKGPN